MQLDEISDIFESENNDEYILDDEIIPIYEAVNNKEEKEKSFSTGFEALDDALEGGFREGDLVIISGVSGEGKTSLAQTFTYHLCKQTIPCLWFSYEVTIERLNEKFQSMGLIALEDYWAYTPKKNTTGKIQWLKGKIKEGWRKYACKVVFVDHLDFLTPTDIRNTDNETIALKKIATELKSLAIELKVTIVAMAHLKKIQDNKEPDMQDIGYSAGIFQLADYVFMIWRKKNNYGRMQMNEGEIYSDESKIKIVKNRLNGRTPFTTIKYANNKFIPYQL
jgi:replicative DNA helicase